MAEQREQAQPRSGLSLKELIIAAGSSTAAFLIVPLFWENGTLFATALTPVIVAIARELLSKPVESAAQVGSRLSAATPVGRRRAGDEPTATEPEPPPDEPRQDERRRRWRRHALRAGLATGLLAFVAVAVVMTASELAVFGKAFGGDSDRPTLVPSSRGADSTPEQQQEEATATPTETATEEATPEEEEEEETPSPTASATPSATTSASPTPAAEGVAPAQQTPAPTTTAAPTP